LLRGGGGRGGDVKLTHTALLLPNCSFAACASANNLALFEIFTFNRALPNHLLNPFRNFG
jgi:hypothetical protein